jgi:nucleotide-binding universal stress UspA family protein
MYKRILIPLENSRCDEAILAHIKPLARLTGANLWLLHVADGWVARNFDRLHLAESEEIKADRAYLEQRATDLRGEGFVVESSLAMGEPADEIIKFAALKEVDMIAMATHGHRFLKDVILGATADKVRHHVTVPVLLLKAATPAA